MQPFESAVAAKYEWRREYRYKDWQVWGGAREQVRSHIHNEQLWSDCGPAHGACATISSGKDDQRPSGRKNIYDVFSDLWKSTANSSTEGRKCPRGKRIICVKCIWFHLSWIKFDEGGKNRNRLYCMSKKSSNSYYILI